jgi:hypothetical protein
MFVTFKNDGLIDMRAISTFGASSKEGDSPIGFFGTGLKYAIAILLREHHDVVMYRGNKKYVFAVNSTKIRNDTFNIVTLDGNELGFTTELGKTWELWQAYRELWCNTMDEQGEVFEGKSTGSPGTTTIVVEGTELAKIHQDRNSITLEDTPDVVLPGLEIRRVPSQYLYYRGIRVQKLERPSCLTYNVTQEITLTEDRTVKYNWQAAGICKLAIVKCHEVDIIKTVLQASEDTFEHAWDFLDLNGRPGTTFRTVSESFQGHHSTNRSAEKLCRDLARKEMEAHQSEDISDDLSRKLDAALALVQAGGEHLSRNNIVIVPQLEFTRLAMEEGDKMFIAVGLLVLPVDDIAKTLYAECMTFDKKVIAKRILDLVRSKILANNGDRNVNTTDNTGEAVQPVH